jgi:hypothetical protein
MNFTTYARSGAELRVGPVERIIDFVVCGPARTFILFCGWDLSEDMPVNNLGRECYVIESIPKEVDGDFVFPTGEVITAFSDEDGHAEFDYCRERIRCGKEKYLENIDNLSKWNKGFDFTEAQAFFKAIPAITVEQIIANMKRSREMLIVRAFDSGGIVIDVLVLDVDGTISTVARDGVLSRAVSAIRGTPGMATPQAARMLFIDWQPQGCSLSAPVIALHSGTTDDIAQSIFLGTL